MNKYGESKTTRIMVATLHDFRFGTSKILGHLIFVEQRVHCLSCQVCLHVHSHWSTWRFKPSGMFHCYLVHSYWRLRRM